MLEGLVNPRNSRLLTEVVVNKPPQLYKVQEIGEREGGER